ncbi:hypothetical protein TNCV_1475961 [Trichonephila clavipes]|nr:hypothetical protein TNCV_1475961 [Trichonephila clavipes]
MVGVSPRPCILLADVFSHRRLKETEFAERIMNINYYVRLRKSATETYEVLKQVKGRESVEDDKRSGRPRTSHTTEYIENVSAAVRKNMLQTTASSVWITSALNMDMMCQHIVLCMLNEDQSAVELKNMVKTGFQKCFDDL